MTTLPLAVVSLLLALPVQETPPDDGAASTPKAPHDVYTITLPKEAAESLKLPEGSAGTGRMLLFFLRDTGRMRRGEPMDAPFYARPQPLASVEVPVLRAGDTITIDRHSLSWPGSLDDLDGTFKVQAVFRRNREARSHQQPGNLYSVTKVVELSADDADEVAITLDQVIKEEPLPERKNLKWVRIKSDLLSRFYGRDIFLNAGVAFPRDYDNLNAKRRLWPTVYVVPGFGGTHRAALRWADMLLTPGTEALACQAVYVVLDPDAPLGHSGFCNSDNNGPRGDALVRELIPAIEDRFRVVPKPEARIITGHSSGGWSSLWLALQYPETFGACFSSAPDPVDFSAFQAGDLYGDANLFVNGDGREQPSYRQPLSPDEDRVMMTVREEIGVESVLGPRGDSGEQWGSWEAMFSRRDPASRLPRAFVDPETGAIDHQVVADDWSRYDIAKLVASNWARYGPILEGKVRLICGERDSYYLNRAVGKLHDLVEDLKKKDVAANRLPPAGPGYIEIIPRATHETIVGLTTLRWNEEMAEFFRKSGLHD